MDSVVATQANALVEAGDAGSKPLVKVFDSQTKALDYMFYAFPQAFRGGVHVATADISGDGVADIIVTPGLGRPAELQVYDGAVLAALANAQGFVVNPAAALITDLFPELPAYRNGLNVAVGDVDGDAIPDIVVSHSRGAPLVRVLQGLGGGLFTQINTINAYPPRVNTGVQVALGDIDGDGISELITAPGTGQVTLIKVFNATTSVLLRQFNAFETSFRSGVSLAAGDLDGDHKAEIIVGAGLNGGSRVRIFNSSLGTIEKEFQAFSGARVNAPLRVLALDPDNAGLDQIYAVQAGRAVAHETRLFDPLSVRWLTL